MNPHYLLDLETGLRLLHELNTVPMSPKRRGDLECALEAVQVVLDLYEVDFR